ncbi:MAG: SRPBCC family protein, partial [Proteobacteria bacterium]|nr:SRPBCC family protein [Pseudomonadota bacterium]
MSRLSFEQTIEVPRSLEFVFGYLCDFTNTAAWDPNVTQAQKTTAGPLQVGTHFDIDINFGWAELRLNYHITHMDP